jgi:hypothetical protein
MHGPEVLVRSLSAVTRADRYGNRWQYHSRSGHHSKIACWGIVFDLLSAKAGDIHHYASMIDRLSNIYSTRFKDL